MTRKPAFWIAMVVMAGLFVTLAIWGKQYYQDRYVGSDYYTMVPYDYDLTPVMRHTMKGDEAGLGLVMVLTAYNEQGESKTVRISLYGDTPDAFPHHGTYLWVSASKTLVVNWKGIDQSDVPATVLEMISQS